VRIVGEKQGNPGLADLSDDEDENLSFIMPLDLFSLIHYYSFQGSLRLIGSSKPSRVFCEYNGNM